MEPKSPGLVSKIKEEPYNKMMRERISTHKNKIKSSAQKLAGIFDEQPEGKSFERSMGVRNDTWNRSHSCTLKQPQPRCQGSNTTCQAESVLTHLVIEMCQVKIV